MKIYLSKSTAELLRDSFEGQRVAEQKWRANKIARDRNYQYEQLHKGN